MGLPRLDVFLGIAGIATKTRRLAEGHKSTITLNTAGIFLVGVAFASAVG